MWKSLALLSRSPAKFLAQSIRVLTMQDELASSGENTELKRKVEDPTSEDVRLTRRIINVREGHRNDERARSLTAQTAFKSESTEQDGDDPTLPTISIMSIDRDLLLEMLSILGSGDLVNVGQTCKLFGSTSAGRQLSLVDQVAKLAFETSATDAERAQLPKYDDESHLSLLNQLEKSRRPLKFDHLVAPSSNGLRTKYLQGDYSKIQCHSDIVETVAASSCTMRAGMHYAVFTIHEMGLTGLGSHVRLGVMRPIRAQALESLERNVYDIIASKRNSRWSGYIHVCQYNCDDGNCFWTDLEEVRHSGESWGGMEGIDQSQASCKVGLLLDLDGGALTVYKNNRLLGIMKSGLTGEYCFCVTLSMTYETVSIKRDSPPT